MGCVQLEAGERTPAGISSCCCQVCGGSSLATSHSYILPLFGGFWYLYFLLSPSFLYFQMGVAPSPTHFRQIKFQLLSFINVRMCH